MIECYTQLPVEVSAVMFDGTNATEIANWVNASGRPRAQVVITPSDEQAERGLRPPAILLQAHGHEWAAERGDWVVDEPYAGFVTVEPDVFGQDFAPAP